MTKIHKQIKCIRNGTVMEELGATKSTNEKIMYTPGWNGLVMWKEYSLAELPE